VNLNSYIAGAANVTVTLNGNNYALADTKGRYTSQLNGVFAVSGAEPDFVGQTLMDMASVTANHDALNQSRLLSTPQAFTSVVPVLDTYISALNLYTSDIAGMYAPGVRGDDFINDDVYSSEYTNAVFANQKAVFTPFDSEDYAVDGYADATQAEHIVILPVKMPYSEHWLSGYIGPINVNKSIQLSTEYSLCVNEQAPVEYADAARAFIDWLATDIESTDAVQLCLRKYHESGAELPLPSSGDREEEGGIAVFGEEMYGPELRRMLSDPDWRADEITELRYGLYVKWLASV
jgi:hypothetical protein